jgi:NADH-quinone oxidoreductase subunit L
VPLTFAAEASPIVEVSGWFLEHVWIAPLLPALAFIGILFFGKRLPYKGAELGIAAVSVALLFSVITGVQWISELNSADDEAIRIVEEKYEAEHGGEEAAALAADGSSVEIAAGSDGVVLAASESAVEAENPVELVEEEGAAVPAVERAWDWFVNGAESYQISFIADGLSVTLLFVVTLVSLLVHVYSTDYVAGDRRYTHFFAFLSLFTAAMLFFVVSGNIIQMIVGWELVGVCSFALIGHWWEEQENSDAALKAFLTNRVGDIGLIIGMILLFFAADSMSVLDVNAAAVAGEIDHLVLLVASCALIAAVMSKSGQFFLHTWLPDAMAGPTPVSALIHAATMVVAGIYMVARLYPVFYEGLSISGSSLNLLAVIGGVTTLVGASLAFVQNDIKKVLAYSTISQLGYMALALGVGAWTAAIFHLFTHAFFKAGLFLGAGSVSHAVHSFDMKKDMGGMRKYMPHTFKTFVICTIALAGIPPLAGFWSKDEILAGTGGWGLAGGTGGNGAYTVVLAMGMLTAAMTAAYMTRVIYLTFFGEHRGHDEAHLHESGRRITVPLWILSGFALVIGLINLPAGFQLVPHSWTERFGFYVEPRPGVPSFPLISHATPSWTLAIVSSIVALGGVAIAVWYYFVKVEAASKAAGRSLTELPNGPTSRFALARVGHTVLRQKYYLDHLYTGVIAAGTKGPVAKAAYWVNQNVIDRLVDRTGETAVKAGTFVYEQVDQKVVDGVVNGSGIASYGAGGELRKMQTGKVQFYAGIMFAAATLLAGVFIVFL